jgi:uracil phosphoribosyltransferase
MVHVIFPQPEFFVTSNLDIILPISSHSLIKTIATQMRNSKNEIKETREYLEEIEKRLQDLRKGFIKSETLQRKIVQHNKSLGTQASSEIS